MFGRGRIKDGVREQAKLLELAPTAKGARQTGKRNVEHALKLQLRGAVVNHEEQVVATKMPLVGDLIPVIVSASDPSRLRIDWDAMPDIADRALASAAAAKRGDAAGAAEAFGFTPRDE
jgi:hypothetical protein